MSKRFKQTAALKRRSDGEEIPLLLWLTAAGIAVFFLIFPYDRGLFNGYDVSFEAPIYFAAIYTFIFMLIPCIYLLRNWKLDGHTGIISIIVLFLPLMYLISSFNAVSGYYAGVMVFVYSLFAFMFVAGLYAAQFKQTRKLIEGGLIVSGMIIVFVGLLNLFGQIYTRDALWLAHDGYRLASVFQYSNTYAGFLIALFLSGLYYVSHSKNNFARFANAAMLAPIWISFMLTYSRGAIVVVPVIILILIPFLRIVKQVTYLVHLVVSVAVSMAILGPITRISKEIALIVQPTSEKAVNTISLFSALPLQAWGLMVMVSVILAAFVYFYDAKLEKWIEARLTKLANHKWSFALIPAVILICSTVLAALLLGSPAVRGLLPQQLAERIANINFNQHSVLERLTFYKDGLRASLDFPFFGAGGGAWQAIYEQYQNNPYESRQAHSFYIQALLEIGWIGLIILLGIFGYVYCLYIRAHIRHPELRGSHLVFLILSLTLLVHSAIDFDISYVYIGAFLFLSLGCMLAPFKDYLVIPRMDKLSWRPWLRAMYPSVLALLSVILLIAVSQNQRAVSNYNETVKLAIQKQTPFNELIDRLDKSIAISPSQTAFSNTKINWLYQSYEQLNDTDSLDQAEKTIALAKKHGSYDRNLLELQLKFYGYKEDSSSALPVLEEALKKFPWQIGFYEKAIIVYANESLVHRETQDTDAADRYKQRALELAEEVQRRVDMLSELPEEQQQGRNFEYTETIKNAVSLLK